MTFRTVRRLKTANVYRNLLTGHDYVLLTPQIMSSWTLVLSGIWLMIIYGEIQPFTHGAPINTGETAQTLEERSTTSSWLIMA